jgi:subtilisin family serine protease
MRIRQLPALGLGAALLLTIPAHAQPTSALPAVTAPNVPLGVPEALPRRAGSLTAIAGEIRAARRAQIRDLRRAHRELIETDPRGEPAVRGEITGLASTPAALAAAQAAGFTVRGEVRSAAFDLAIVRLAVPPGMSTRRALKKIRALDPDGLYDFNHIYLQAGETAGSATPAPPAAASSAVSTAALRIGLVDGGVDTSHPAFAAATVHRTGCTDKEAPTDHGTAVASLLVGRTAEFSGVMPSAALFAADVYCGAPTGGNVIALASALAWLAAEGVRVINVSLVGARNIALEKIIARLVASGHIIVAAVGNDGPAAPPLYPAAYPGVVAVTGVDARRRVLVEAGRGPHVAFAAPGADMAAAASGASFAAVRGTSFAAPIVAALLALEHGMEHDSIETATARLALSAIDLGRDGRDDTYGIGLVGSQFRMDPQRLAARGAD